MEIEERFIIEGISQALKHIFLEGSDEFRLRECFVLCCTDVIEKVFKNPENYSPQISEMIKEAMIHTGHLFKEGSGIETWEEITTLEEKEKNNVGITNSR